MNGSYQYRGPFILNNGHGKSKLKRLTAGMLGRPLVSFVLLIEWRLKKKNCSLPAPLGGHFSKKQQVLKQQLVSLHKLLKWHTGHFKVQTKFMTACHVFCGHPHKETAAFTTTLLLSFDLLR